MGKANGENQLNISGEQKGIVVKKGFWYKFNRYLTKLTVSTIIKRELKIMGVKEVYHTRALNNYIWAK